jgi:hypothetical protein
MSVPNIFSGTGRGGVELLDENFEYVNAKILDVKDYGAVGDGVTDDRAAIQACIDYVSSVGGGIVFFPIGTYLLGSVANGNGLACLVYPSNVHFVGAGRKVVILKQKSGAGVASSHNVIEPINYGDTTSVPFSTLGYYTTSNSFSGFSIDGNIAGNPGNIFGGITTAGVKDSVMYDMESYNCGESGFHAQVTNVGTDYDQTCLIQACVAYDNVSDGFQFGGAMVRDCFAYGNLANGFNSAGNFVTGSGDLIVSQVVNCRAMHNNDAGFVSNLQTGPHIRTVFSNCAAIENVGFGFTCVMDYTIINSCLSMGNAKDGIILQADYCVISDTVSMNNGQIPGGALNFQSGLAVIGAVNYCSVSGVTLTDDQASKTQLQAVAFSAAGGGGNNSMRNCTMSGNINASNYQINSASGWQFSNNEGFNPVGGFGVGTNPANPAVPATTVAQTNVYGYPVQVTISGGTVTVIAINGLATGLTSGSFIVGPNQTIAITYTVVPTWRWWGL